MITKLESRVTILKAQPRPKRLAFPVEVEGRKFTTEIVEEFAPYHRKLPAHVEDRNGGKVVSLRKIADVALAMRVRIKGDEAEYAIGGIVESEQDSEDIEGKKSRITFTELHCKPLPSE